MTQQKAPRPKRHHYLPQSYLEGFCRDDKLWIYDRETKEIREQAPINTAVIGHYYSHEAEDGSKNPIVEEQFLQIIDGWFPLLRGVLMNRGQFGFDDRKAMSMILALFLLRTPSFQNFVEAFQTKIVQRMADLSFSDVETTTLALATWEKDTGHKSTVTPEALFEFNKSRKYTIRIPRNVSIRAMLELYEPLAAELFGMKWFVLHLENPRTSLVTSDAPFVVHPPRGARAAGISTPGAVKTMPLHQSLLLCVGDRSESWEDCVHLEEGDATKIRRTNEATASVSVRFVIGRDRALVERISKAPVGS